MYDVASEQAALAPVADRTPHDGSLTHPPPCPPAPLRLIPCPWPADLADVQLLVCYHLGANHCDTEEPSAGEKYLNQVVDASASPLTKRGAAARLAALNQLGILWANRSEFEKGLARLQAAEELYKEMTSSALFQENPPYCVHE